MKHSKHIYPLRHAHENPAHGVDQFAKAQKKSGQTKIKNSDASYWFSLGGGASTVGVKPSTKKARKEK